MILFSPELFSIQSIGGVTRCMLELMCALDPLTPDWRVWAGRHGSRGLEDSRDRPCMRGHVHADPIGPLPGRRHAAIAGERAFAAFARTFPAAVIHRTHYPMLDLAPRRMRRVATLHDLWSERAGAPAVDRVRSLFKRRALERVDRIVCVSQTTHDVLAQTWPHLIGKSVVILHGVRRLSVAPTAAARDRPFFLFVGGRRQNKNWSVVVRALGASAPLAGFDLVCVGGGAFDAAEQAEIDAAGLGARVCQRAADDDGLAGLYEAAAALVYPSRHEGFGMPLLEAMIHDCPAIAAPLSCLPEIGGDAAIYADADAPEEWAAQMLRVVEDGAFRARQLARGRARAAALSWAANAQAHGALYRSMT